MYDESGSLSRPSNGIVSVYESGNFWEKESKKHKSKRRCIGKMDEAGHIVPPGHPGRERKRPPSVEAGGRDLSSIKAEYDARLKEQALKIHEPETALVRKRQELDDFLTAPDRLTARLREE